MVLAKRSAASGDENGFTRDTIKSVFKRKRNCFVPFPKRFASTRRFRIVFARPHYNAVSVLKTLLYPQCACSNELDACAFQYIAPQNFLPLLIPCCWVSLWFRMQKNRGRASRESFYLRFSLGLKISCFFLVKSK